uniref:Uncharacterized protein n=1 Tax=Lotharella globosa TaxID=91324 RepID=A0A7S3ZA33_9EUKA
MQHFIANQRQYQAEGLAINPGDVTEDSIKRQVSDKATEIYRAELGQWRHPDQYTKFRISRGVYQTTANVCAAAKLPNTAAHLLERVLRTSGGSEKTQADLLFDLACIQGEGLRQHSEAAIKFRKVCEILGRRQKERQKEPTQIEAPQTVAALARIEREGMTLISRMTLPDKSAAGEQRSASDESPLSSEAEDLRYGQAHFNLGLCMKYLGNWTGALSEFDSAGKLADHAAGTQSARLEKGFRFTCFGMFESIGFQFLQYANIAKHTVQTDGEREKVYHVLQAAMRFCTRRLCAVDLCGHPRHSHRAYVGGPTLSWVSRVHQTESEEKGILVESLAARSERTEWAVNTWFNTFNNIPLDDAQGTFKGLLEYITRCMFRHSSEGHWDRVIKLAEGVNENFLKHINDRSSLSATNRSAALHTGAVIQSLAADAYKEKGQADEAIVESMRALDLLKRSRGDSNVIHHNGEIVTEACCWHNMGWGLWKRGDYEESISMYVKAMKSIGTHMGDEEHGYKDRVETIMTEFESVLKAAIKSRGRQNKSVKDSIEEFRQFISKEKEKAVLWQSETKKALESWSTRLARI